MPRPRLERRLDRIPGGGLGTVIAPAGSGKSVVVTQWLDSLESVAVARLELAHRHHDRAVFLRELLDLLDTARHPNQDSPGSGGADLGAEPIDVLVRRFDDDATDVVVVLEDLHHVAGSPVIDDIGALARRLPRMVRLVVTSRWDPPWSLTRLRVDDRLVELRATDLAFTHGEAAKLVAAVSGATLREDHLASVLDRTEGWAVALQLAAISIRDADDVDATVASLAGTDRVISEYLVEEVLDQQPDELREFLLRTSLLDWFTPQLCDAVTGGTGEAWKRLDELQHRSLFLIVVDSAIERYRYHHLFADLLRFRLRRDHPDDVGQIHRAAADWLLGHANLTEAIAHLLAAEEDERAYELISMHGHGWFERDEPGLLVGWLTTLVERAGGLELAPARMCIDLMAVQIAVDDSPAASTTYRHLVRRGDLSAAEHTTADTLDSLLVLRELPPELARQRARSARQRVEDIRPEEMLPMLGLGERESIEVMTLYTEGWAALMLGDTDGALDLWRSGLEHPGCQYPMWRIYLQSVQSLLLAWLGRSSEASTLASAAIESADRFGTTRREALIGAHLALALVHIDRLESAAAAEHLATVAGTARRLRSSMVLVELHRTIEARLRAVTEGPSSALDALDALDALSVSPAAAPWLHECNRDLANHLRVRMGSLSTARAQLRDVRDGAFAARTDLALASDDLDGARAIVESWSPAPGVVRDEVGRGLRLAALLDAEGDTSAAYAALDEAVAIAEGEQMRWPFLGVPGAMRLLRRRPAASPRLLEPLLGGDAPALDRRIRTHPALTEQLTERELAILSYLPSRSQNSEVAAALFISVNTLKSHLRSVYRKLDVNDRDQAVMRATELGLL